MYTVLFCLNLVCFYLVYNIKKINKKQMSVKQRDYAYIFKTKHSKEL